ncbi:MAG TPA: MarR family transcriptional regulator [Gemmatimonadaceae bacterium]|nr:MarR family transcriptional regulator [Gemmatimonadaceae bacterium]
MTRLAGVYTPIAVEKSIDLSATRACHCLAARRQARAITRIFEEKLRPHGLRATQFSILAVLSLKGTTPVKALADVLGLERTTLTRVSGLLERKGLVDTVESPDGRERPLRITPTGRRTLERAFPAWKEAQELVEGRLAGPVRQLR